MAVYTVKLDSLMADDCKRSCMSVEYGARCSFRAWLTDMLTRGGIFGPSDFEVSRFCTAPGSTLVMFCTTVSRV